MADLDVRVPTMSSATPPPTESLSREEQLELWLQMKGKKKKGRSASASLNDSSNNNNTPLPKPKQLGLGTARSENAIRGGGTPSSPRIPVYRASSMDRLPVASSSKAPKRFGISGLATRIYSSSTTTNSSARVPLSALSIAGPNTATTTTTTAKAQPSLSLPSKPPVRISAGRCKKRSATKPSLNTASQTSSSSNKQQYPQLPLQQSPAHASFLTARTSQSAVTPKRATTAVSSSRHANSSARHVSLTGLSVDTSAGPPVTSPLSCTFVQDETDQEATATATANLQIETTTDNNNNNSKQDLDGFSTPRQIEISCDATSRSLWEQESPAQPVAERKKGEPLVAGFQATEASEPDQAQQARELAVAAVARLVDDNRTNKQEETPSQDLIETDSGAADDEQAAVPQVGLVTDKDDDGHNDFIWRQEISPDCQVKSRAARRKTDPIFLPKPSPLSEMEMELDDIDATAQAEKKDSKLLLVPNQDTAAAFTPKEGLLLRLPDPSPHDSSRATDQTTPKESLLLAPLEDDEFDWRTEISPDFQPKARPERRTDASFLLLPVPSPTMAATPTHADQNTAKESPVPAGQSPTEASTVGDAAAAASRVPNVATAADALPLECTDFVQDAATQSEEWAGFLPDEDDDEESVASTGSATVDSHDDEDEWQDRFDFVTSKTSTKLNGRTLLTAVPEDDVGLVDTELDTLRQQFQQMQVERKKLADRLYAFRKSYDDRVGPFRDAFDDVSTVQRACLEILFRLRLFLSCF